MRAEWLITTRPFSLAFSVSSILFWPRFLVLQSEGGLNLWVCAFQFSLCSPKTNNIKELGHTEEKEWKGSRGGVVSRGIKKIKVLWCVSRSSPGQTQTGGAEVLLTHGSIWKLTEIQHTALHRPSLAQELTGGKKVRRIHKKEKCMALLKRTVRPGESNF